MSKKENLNIISKLFKKINILDNGQSLRDSIQDVIEEKSSDENGSLDLTIKEKSILTNILSINKLKVDDVMIPRASITAVSHDSSFESLIEVIQNESHSRMPVFRKDLDDVIGMIHIKDLIKFAGSKSKEFSIQNTLREVLFVPPTMPVLTLLLKMQATKRHMALVIDEHGGTDGLVTIEDAVEEIVGEIEDEHDKDDDFDFKKIDSSTFKAKASMTLEDFNHESNFNILQKNVDTLGGFVFSNVNRVPCKGEIIKIDDKYQFEILESDPRKIKNLKIIKL